MKRILTLLFLSALFAQAQAQVLFSQDFESATIAPMTAVDVDGKTVHPSVANVAGPTWSLIGDATNIQVVSTSWFNPVGQADDWLISPAIEIADSNTFLIWDAYSPDAQFRDGYEVRVSTTDDEIASFTDVVLTVPAELTSRNTRSLRLDAYVGQTIHFAFRNNSNDKFLLYMDNISVNVLKANDVIVRDITYEKYNQVGNEVTVSANLQNFGYEPLTSVLMTLEYGSESYTDTITSLNVGILGRRNFTHTFSIDLTEEGEFPFTVTFSNPNGVEDENPTDNGATRRVYGLSTQLPKKVVVEEATGTWCGWCPRGTVNMDLLAEEHADVAIPIAVHNTDPMEVEEYDDALGATIGGYPSGHVDRKSVDIDPADFIAAVESIQDRLVPVAVTTVSSYDPDTRMATITGTGYFSVPTQANDLRFTCVLTENNVTGTATTPGYGFSQVNYYAGGGEGPMGGFENLPEIVPAEDMVYQFVARALLGGFYGLENSIPDSLAANEEFTIEFSYQVPEDFEPEEMKAIIFIQDEATGEILNGDMVDLQETVSVEPLIPAGQASLKPNVTSDLMNLTVDFQTDAQVSLRIYNTYGGLVRDLGVLNLASGLHTEQINVAEFASGMYILELRHKNAVTALPFTKI